MNHSRIVVVGVGTGVGKTHLSIALVETLTRAGEAAVALKPIESGWTDEGDSDAARFSRVGTFHVKHRPLYAFSEPVSPHLAARRAGATIDLARTAEWVAARSAAWTIVETAGGLLTPLGPNLTNKDLAVAIKPTAVVLVACDELGVLHDVTAALLALRVLGAQLPTAAVVLQSPASPDASTGTNGPELVGLGVTARVFVIPRAEARSGPVLLIAESLRAALQASSPSTCFT